MTFVNDTFGRSFDNSYLRDLIISGVAKPSFVVSHNVPLTDAADAYVKFDKRIDGYSKVSTEH